MKTSSREFDRLLVTDARDMQAVILIDLKDRAGTLTFHGKFDWFLSAASSPQL